MKAYAERANDIKIKCCYLKLNKISRPENEAVDRLAKITFGETPNGMMRASKLNSTPRYSRFNNFDRLDPKKAP